MSINATQVKELRDRTGLGMMECKNALVEAKGDMDVAAEILRLKAGAKVDKKAGRIAADGAIAISMTKDRKVAAVVEVNCETDFVGKRDEFLGFASAVADAVQIQNPENLEAAMSLKLEGGQSITEERERMVATLGENIALRRFERLTGSSGNLGYYVHGRKIGVIVDLEGGDNDLAKDIAMHIAASRPQYISKDLVPSEVVEKEKSFYMGEAKQTGKPEEIIEKMVHGKVNKYLNEISLLGQAFVKDPDQTVGKLLKGKGAEVMSFVRYEVGEGIEKGPDDFAAEVMAQVKGG
jgi:elongation factor Ts